MADKYLNLQGSEKINETYDEINQGFDLVEVDIDAIEADYDNHVAGTNDKHDAEDINYSGDVAGATNVKQALDNTDSRIDTIVTGDATSVAEVVDSRYSSVKDVSYSTLTDRLNANETDIKQLKDFLKLNDVYGIYWDSSANTVTRIGAAEDTVQADYDGIMPWAGMQRCNLSDAGVVNDYYGDPGYIEDGTNGQVMVEVPNFYYTSAEDSDGIYWAISMTFKNGFKPAVLLGDDMPEYFYVSAYEGCLYDTSATVYLANDEQVGDFTATTGDVLSSIAGVQPASGETQALNIDNARIIAQNRGTGWNLAAAPAWFAIQLMMYVEYATFDIQTQIGDGIVGWDSGTSNHAQDTGHTASLGNTSGEVEINPVENGLTGSGNPYAMSYRGIENFYGNIWTFIDGINIKADNELYINLTNEDLESDVFTSPYQYVDTLPSANGYMASPVFNNVLDIGFICATTGASNIFYSYYYQSTGNRIARFGGDWTNSAGHVGAACWALTLSSASGVRNSGARLQFIK